MFENPDFSKFNDFPTKIGKLNNRRELFQYSSLIPSCEIFLHCSKSEPSYVRKCESFESQRFFLFAPFKMKNSKITENCFFNVEIQSLHVKFCCTEVISSRLKFENLFFFEIQQFPPFKSKIPKSPKNVFLAFKSCFLIQELFTVE